MKNLPSYLFNLIPNFNRVHNTMLRYNIPAIKVRHVYSKNSFFLLLHENGTALNLTLEIQQASILLKRSF